VPTKARDIIIDSTKLYGLGASWGGFESLIMPFDPHEVRTATRWPHAGPCFRIHAGLEHIDDLIADLDQAFKRMRAGL
jgi:cystathionine beta-lyase